MAFFSLSAFIIGINIYLSSQFISEVTRFNLSAVDKQAYAIASGVGLPLACLIISQLFIKWRGLTNAVKSVLAGAVIALLAQAPVIFYLIQ